MRRSYECDIVGLDEEIIGFSFGSDFTSEHEWGIDDLRRYLGMDNKAVGFDRHLCHNYKGLRVYEIGDELMVLYTPGEITLFRPHPKPEDITKKEFNQMKTEYDLNTFNEKIPFVAAWDDSSFGILAVGEDAKKQLRRGVIEPWNDQDAAVFLRRLTKDSRGGLNIVRASKFPQKIKDDMRAEQISRENLQKAKQATGIEEILRAAGKQYFALSPRWAKDMNWKKKTAYDVVFWLNPYHQSIDNYGYFTVEELLLWAEGKGPIPKKH